MPRDFRAYENAKMAKAKRQAALARPEMLLPSTPRVSAAGATSFAVKAADPELHRMIEDFKAKERT